MPDWFDPEFDTVINNWRVTAEFYKKGGLVGVLFGDEAYYGTHLWNHPPTAVRGDSAAYQAAAAAGSASPVIVAFSDLQEHDSPGAIGTSWRGEKRLQITQTPRSACEPRANHSLMRNTMLGVEREKWYTRLRWPLMFVGKGANRGIPG